MSQHKDNSGKTGLEIAVIGIAGRFPGASNIDEFWRIIKNGSETISFFSEEELEEVGIGREVLSNANYIKAGGFLKDKDLFDNGFFGYTPEESALMDPQMRIFHECAWESLENAGYNPFEYEGLMGIYAGGADNLPWEVARMTEKNPDLGRWVIDKLSNINYLSARIAYTFNLKGPAVTINTACSTSLAAVHLACQGLLSGECEIAIAGGIEVSANKKSGYLYQEGLILSSDGHCRAFDAKATGTVGGEGVGVAVLKLLSDAERDHDHIYAVIKGSAMNNDGHSKVGFTSPSVRGQREVIKTACRLAEVDAESISYIEAHGTGTPLGDLVEIQALKQAFENRLSPCALGSVKNNVGHLGAAAGITSLIKTVLMLKNRMLPPTVNYDISHPELGLVNHWLYANKELRDWNNDNYPLRAGVSSFGVGGTNVHVILEEAPEIVSLPYATEKNYEILLLSARTRTAVEAMRKNLAGVLQGNNSIELRDVAFTLNVGRKEFPNRYLLVCRDCNEAAAILSDGDFREEQTGFCREEGNKVIFMFPGRETQYMNLGLGLYRTESIFKQEVEKCLEILKDFIPDDPSHILYPDNGQAVAADTGKAVKYAQPLIFIIEYALAKLLMRLDVKPYAMIGQGLGEYTAACIAGVFSLRDALRLVTASNRAMELLKIKFHRPLIPYISNVSGHWITAKEATDPEYWIEHLRNAAKFDQGFSLLLKEKNLVLVETGPGKTLSTLVLQHADRKQGHKTLNLLRLQPENTPDEYFFLNRLGQLWLYGIKIDWKAYYSPEHGKRVPLPSYPFERNKFEIAINSPDDVLDQRSDNKEKAAPVKKRNISEWFYIPVWEQSAVIKPSLFKEEQDLKWLVFANSHQLCSAVWDELKKASNVIVKVEAGRNYAKLGADHFTIDIGATEDYRSLFDELEKTNRLPNAIIHFWSLTDDDYDREITLETLERSQKEGLHAVLNIVREIGAKNIPTKIKLFIITNNLHDITGEGKIAPEKATLLGAVKIVPLEYLNIECKNVDITDRNYDAANIPKFSEYVLRELAYPSHENIVVLHGAKRWIRKLKPVLLEPGSKSVFKEDGVYVITGGHGGIGITLAEHIAGISRARIIIIGRSGLPAKDKWEQWLLEHDSADPVSGRIRKVREIESLGSEITTIVADVADLDKMSSAFNAIISRYGKINGIIHAAGVIDTGGVIRRRSKEITDRFMSPKVKGTVVLNSLIREMKLDFMVFFSSIGNIIYKEKFGQISYNASNEFLEAFAAYKYGRDDTYTVAINWCDWAEVGMSVDAEKKKRQAGGDIYYTSILQGKLLPAEGIEAFNRIVPSGLSHVAVSPVDLFRILDIQNELKLELDTFMTVANIKGSGESGSKTELIRDDHQAGDSTEKVLTRLFQSFFGIEQVGTDDDFFELGGDSLKAMSLAAKINNIFNVKIPLNVFFEKPKIKEIALYIDDQKGDCPYQSITPAENKDCYRLSSAQQRMFFLQNMDMQSTVYNNVIIKHLPEDISESDLESIFMKLIERHESLRTSFQLKNGIPVQLINNATTFKIAKIDLTNHSSKIDEVINNCVRPFDLSKAPLMRVTVINTPDRGGILLIDIHHIISDLISLDLLYRDFIALRRKETLDPVGFHYKDYAEWQDSEEYYETIKKQEKYWLELFSGEISVLKMPGDFKRPKIPSYNGQIVTVEILEAETAQIRQLLSDKAITMHSFLLAAFNVLLYKLTGQTDIVVGAPVSGRVRNEFQNVVGLYVNTLALRFFPEGPMRFTEFIGEVSKSTVEAFENQEYPFERLIDKVALVRDASYNPIFNIMFNYLDHREFSGEVLKDIELQRTLRKNVKAKFDMMLTVRDIGSGLYLEVEYCTDLYKTDTVKRFINYYKNIVKAVLRNNELKLAEIDILSKEEKKRLLFDFNRTEPQNMLHRTVNAVFETKAGKTPHKTALVCGEHVLSYLELDRKTNQLGGILRSKGVKSESIVAVIVERSIEMVVALLGVLKAGGAYLPIDPQCPADRLKYILEDSKSGIILTRKKLRDSFTFDGQVIILDDEDLYSGDCRTLVPVSGPHNLIYVMYTSGSTGMPKGVMVEHYSVINILSSLQREYPLLEDDAYLLKTNYTFDVSVVELFGWFFGAGKLVILGDQMEKDPLDMLRVIHNHHITHLNFVPSMLNEFIEALSKMDESVYGSVKYIFSAGEAIPAALVKKIHNLRKEIKLENLYGPTETTVYATHYSIPGEAGDYETIPIGKPFPNVRIYILDKEYRLLPVGVAGELCIAGAGVARGYLNQTELTKGKFIENPYCKGEKLYLSGDIARWLADGNIEYLGRNDYQVKIRGFRIELGEVENYLLTSGFIKEAAVVALVKDENSAPANKFLCAYIVPGYAEGETDISVEMLREYLGGKMPEYMIPSYFIRMERLPLTPSGKIDRKALPEPDADQVMLGNSAYGAPRNKIEEKMVEVWKDVLGTTSIGINDNFFTLGGDSIRAIQVVSKLSEGGYKLITKDIFDYPVIAKLSAHVKLAGRAVDQLSVSGVAPLTPIQHDFFAASNNQVNHYNQSVLLKFKDMPAEKTIRDIFEKIQEHHDALRLTFQNDGDSVIQYNKETPFPVSLDVYDLRGQDSDAEMELRADQLQSGIDLANGPLMKLGLFYTDNGAFLLIAVHHLVIDGISWRILLEDSDALYNQHLTGEKLELPAKTCSYKCWAEKLHNYAQSEAVRNEVEYWKSILQTETGKLTKDFNNEKNQVKDVNRIAINIDEGQTERLLQVATGAIGVEINEILITALGLSINKQYGIKKLLVALEGHGREFFQEEIDISRTVGWFTCIYPVVLDLTNGPDIPKQIRAVKECLRRVKNRGIGYGVIKYLLPGDPEDKAVFKDNPQIVFNYLGQFDADLNRLSAFEIFRAGLGNEFGAERARGYELEVSGIVLNKSLEMSISYSKFQYKSETIRAILDNFKITLAEVTDFCLASKNRQIVPSEMTYNGLTLEELDDIQIQTGAEIEDVYKLTPLQQGILFHSLYAPSSTAYFNQATYYIKGEHDAGFLKECFEMLFQRHEALRTRFVFDSIDEPLQVVIKEPNLCFAYHDVRNKSDLEKEKYLDDFKEADQRNLFNLRRDTLLRLNVIRTSDDRYWFIWSYHHIIIDGWCLGILIAEFIEIYKSRMQGNHLSLPEPVPFKKYLKWIDRQSPEAAQKYWSKYLEGSLRTVVIPSGGAVMPSRQKYTAGKAVLTFKGERFQRLNNLALKYKVTLNTVIQTIWGIVLSNLNDTRDVVFGSVVSGRTAAIDGIESVVGIFVNTIPVRIRYDDDTTFEELLQITQNKAMESDLYNYYSLAEIQAESPPKQALITHIYSFQNYPLPERLKKASNENESEKNDYDIYDVNVDEHDNYDFEIMVSVDRIININLQYNKLLYKHETVVRILNYISYIAGLLIDNDRVMVKDINIMNMNDNNSDKAILAEFKGDFIF
jgi:amino acid adenylation domain-containing protein/non-ribosomal peptide synthase protein (TIGR01720 family)